MSGYPAYDSLCYPPAIPLALEDGITFNALNH